MGSVTLRKVFCTHLILRLTLNSILCSNFLPKLLYFVSLIHLVFNAVSKIISEFQIGLKLMVLVIFFGRTVFFLGSNETKKPDETMSHSIMHSMPVSIPASMSILIRDHMKRAIDTMGSKKKKIKRSLKLVTTP